MTLLYYFKNYPILFILFFASIIVKAQNCHCDKFIGLTHAYLVDGIVEGIKPGDTVCIEAGQRQNLSFKNIIGTKEQPVVIINCGGKAIFNTTTSYGVEFKTSKYFKFTGTGSADIPYGMEIKNSYLGLNITYLSSNCEVDHVQIHDVSFAGLMIKTDPVCNDTLTWKQNYTMYDVNIHHNEIFNTQTGEGMYIGYSFYGTGVQCDTNIVDSHEIINAKIHHNYVHDTGAEGIQVSSATQGCEIYNNNVISYGQNPFNGSSSQQNGIQIGNGTGGLCYSNFIKAGTQVRGANGIILLGKGDNLLFNNIIINPGENGIFIDERPPATLTGPGSFFKIINNTIVNTVKDGIKTYAELVEFNEIKNNIIFVSPGIGKYINTAGGPGHPVVLESNNLKSNDISFIKFSNPTMDDYHLTDLSPAKNAGLNCAPWNIFYDLENSLRPNGSGFDIGAMELYPDVPNILPSIVVAEDEIQIQPPVDSIKVSAIISDPDGTIDSIWWEQIEGPELNFTMSDSAALIITNVNEGNYIFKVSARDNANAISNKEIALQIKAIPNSFPIANAGPDSLIQYPNNNITLIGTGSDSDGAVIQMRWTQKSGPAVTIPTINSDTLKLTGLQAGTYVFQFRVTDDSLNTSLDNMTLVVNFPPIVNAGNDTLIIIPGQPLTLKGKVTDVQSDTLTFNWIKMSGPNVTMSGDNTSNLNIGSIASGQYQFRLTVTDNYGALSFDDINIKVNFIPIVNAGKDSVIIYPKNTITINGNATDPDGTISSYLWRKISGPSATLSNLTSKTLTLTSMQLGAYIFELTATDNSGAIGRDTIQVAMDKPPVAKAGSDKIINLPISSTNIVGSATDPDGNPITILWTKVSGPAVSMNGTTTATLNLSNITPGNYVFRITVKDIYGLSSFDDMNLFANNPPVVNAGPDKTIKLPVNSVTLPGSATDSDGTIASYAWSKISGPSATLANKTTNTLTVNNIKTGTYVFRLTAKDNNGGIGFDDVTLIVNK